MYTKKITGKLCYLSPIQAEDTQKFYEWVNDFETSIFITVFPQIITFKQEQEFINNVSSTNNENYIMSIVDIKTDELLGNCGLHKVDFINRNAEIGIFIGNKNYLKKGYGKEAVELMLDFGFNALNLHNIWAKVYSYNSASIKMLKKVGFTETGKMRQLKIMGDKYFDILNFDILKSEYQSVYIQKALTNLFESKK